MDVKHDPNAAAGGEFAVAQLPDLLHGIVSDHLRVANGGNLQRICSEKDIPAVLGETAIVKLLGLSRTTAYYLLQSEAFPTQGYATGTMKKKNKQRSG